MKKFLIIYSIIITIVLICISYLYFTYKQENEDKITIETSAEPIVITDVAIDTFKVSSKEFIIKTDTIILKDSLKIVDTVYIPKHQIQYTDTLENLNYTAFVSGYNPELDSIKFNIKQTHIKNNKISVGVGVGIDVLTFKPYIGIGVNYKLF